MSEIPRFHRAQLDGIPRCARGYYPNEFIYFKWDKDLLKQINPSEFKVIFQDLAGRNVSLGKLQQRVLLPNHFFDPHAPLVVVGLDKRGYQVRYIAELTRGNQYELMSATPGDQTMNKSIPRYNVGFGNYK